MSDAEFWELAYLISMFKGRPDPTADANQALKDLTKKRKESKK